MANEKKYIIKDACGRFWTGECWGCVEEVAEEYTLTQLSGLNIDEEVNEENFFNNFGIDIGWGDEDGRDIYALARPVD